MASTAQRIDPIGSRYFTPLRQADMLSDVLFFATGALSFGALLVNKATYPGWYDFVQGAFILLAVTLFVIGQVIRLYLWPRAEDRRREEFLSNTLGINLTHERTSGYYNNDESEPIRRMGVAILENTHFTKAVALEMAKWERVRIMAYTGLWLVALLNRHADLGWIAVSAQVLFSEQFVARWLRIEWLRVKAEEIHTELRKVFGSNPNQDMLRAYVLDAFATYETAKANGGIVLSSKIFYRLNEPLSEEWDKIKASMGLTSS